MNLAARAISREPLNLRIYICLVRLCAGFWKKNRYVHRCRLRPVSVAQSVSRPRRILTYDRTESVWAHAAALLLSSKKDGKWHHFDEFRWNDVKRHLEGKKVECMWLGNPQRVLTSNVNRSFDLLPPSGGPTWKLSRCKPVPCLVHGVRQRTGRCEILCKESSPQAPSYRRRSNLPP